MTPVDRLRRSWVQRTIIAMNLMLIAISLGAALVLHYGYGRAAAINRVALDRSLTAVPPHQEAGERVINILLVGSDSSAGLEEGDPIQIGRQGERFGDVIIVAHVDERSGEMALLSLPRDLWVEIGDSGRESRINRAFVTGGPAELIETIEGNFDIPIHHYVNVDFAGFQGLVSAVGSVDVYFETPARDWNVNARPVPRSQTGFSVDSAGCHSLGPVDALAYVRSRFYQTQTPEGDWITDPTSDLGRIRRQQDFLRRLLGRAIDVGARNPFVLRDLIETGLDHVAIDQALTPQLLLDIGATYRSFDPEQLQTYSFPAVDGQVGQNRVLLPLADQAAPVLALFRGAGFDDPITVDLTVAVAPERHLASGSAGSGQGQQSEREPELGATVLAALEQAGYEPQIASYDTITDPGPGLVVRHGPDGRPAADLVLATIGDAAVEQVSWLTGRSVQVLVGEAPEVDSVADPAAPSPELLDRADRVPATSTATSTPVAADPARCG